jgi:hypothetical protein
MARAQPTCLGGREGEKDPRNLGRWSERIARVLNGNVSFGSTMSNKDVDMNLSIFKFSGTGPAANTDFTLPHSLGRIPITIVGQDTQNGGLVYRGSVAWTKTACTFRCTTAAAQYNIIVA